MATPIPRILAVALLSVLAAPVSAQAPSYRDFTLVRDREQPYRSLLQVRAGYRGTVPREENRVLGQVDDGFPDGFVLFHTKELTAKQDWTLDMYGGIDGAYLGLKDELTHGNKAQTRLEVFGRPRAFYREGYYDAGRFLINGQYEGRDYGTRLSTAQRIQEGLVLDLGAFYRKNTYDRNSQSDLRPDYVIPDDHNAFGAVATLEQNTVRYDRTLGLPLSGFLWTIAAEYEKNDSDRRFGSQSSYESSLPNGFWRGDARLESYFPNGKSGVWEILIDGGLYDKLDRITSYHAERVQGHIWADATLGYRMAFGETLVVKPYGEVQYARILDQAGRRSDDEVFFGGGLDLSVLFAQNMALVLSYSYVDNPSRSPVSWQDDFYGEHQFFVGLDVSFGSGYRR